MPALCPRHLSEWAQRLWCIDVHILLGGRIQALQWGGAVMSNGCGWRGRSLGFPAILLVGKAQALQWNGR